jgi:hypothetical protein
MKILEITQSGWKNLGQDFNAVADQIERDCTQYLASVKQAGRFLYRGEGGDTPWMFLGRSRQNRPPLHSSAQAQQYFDQCLKKLGFTALRSNSVFATSDYAHAKRFGKPYVIFPMDHGSAYTYTNQYDITLSVSSITHMVNHKKLRPVVDQLVARLQPLPDVSPVLRNINAVSDRSTVLRNLEKFRDNYIAVGADPQWFNIDISEFLDEHEFQSYYHPANSDLQDAIEEQYEVYISGEYYAVWWNHYSDELDRRFNI